MHLSQMQTFAENIRDMFASYLRIQCRQPLAIVAAAFSVLLQQAPKVETLKSDGLPH